jgi:hypothetical protein
LFLDRELDFVAGRVRVALEAHMEGEAVVLAPESVGSLPQLLVEFDLLERLAVDEDQAAPDEVPPQLFRLGHEVDAVLHDAGHAEGCPEVDVLGRGINPHLALSRPASRSWRRAASRSGRAVSLTTTLAPGAAS